MHRSMKMSPLVGSTLLRRRSLFGNPRLLCNRSRSLSKFHHNLSASRICRNDICIRRKLANDKDVLDEKKYCQGTFRPFLQFKKKFTYLGSSWFSTSVAKSSISNLEYSWGDKDDLERLTRIRNVGIFAHVDAGKTTVTERMLALAGVIQRVGSVDEGNTVTDYLPAERERGITIQAAAISFDWALDRHNNIKGFDHGTVDSVTVHLIDTPGHVDFSLEVNRSVAVLDGAILVIDSVAGVQAQTETVWRAMTNQIRCGSIGQNSTHSKEEHCRQWAGHEPLSCIAFINKMDKDGCNFAYALDSLKQKLPGANPVPIQIPLFHLGQVKEITPSQSLIEPVPKSIWAADSKDTTTSVVQLGQFAGIVDLIHMRAIIYPDTDSVNVSCVESCSPAVYNLLTDDFQHPIDTASQVTKSALAARQDLLASLAEIDDVMEDFFLSEKEPSSADILLAVRRLTVSRKIMPVMAGAAVRGKGVEPLLDAIADFLPTPLDRLPPALTRSEDQNNNKYNKEIAVTRSSIDGKGSTLKIGHPLHPSLLALAFKVIHMKNRGGSGDGRVVFARIYSGKVSTKDTLKVVSPNFSGETPSKPRTERVGGMLELAGGRFNNMEDSVCRSGDVCALIGLKSVVTGDTLLLTSDPLSSELPGEKSKRKIVDSKVPIFESVPGNVSLTGVSFIKPVLTVRIEAESSEEQKRLSSALKLLAVEDPSLHVEDNESATLVSGLGELHIEIIVDRLRREFGLSVWTGKPVVTYRETANAAVETPGLVEYDRILGTSRLQAAVHLIIEPTCIIDSSSGSSCFLLSEPKVIIGANARNFLGLSLDLTEEELTQHSAVAHGLISGCHGALKRGPIGSYGLANVRCHILDVNAPGGTSSLNAMPGALRAAASYAVSSTLSSNKSSFSLLEPAMSVEITVPEIMVGTVVSDLSSRRGTISDVVLGDSQVGGISKAVVRGEIPLAEILGYANSLRSVTGGEGHFSAEYRGHSII